MDSCCSSASAPSSTSSGTDEFERLSMQLMMKFEGYGVVPGLNGDGLDKAMGRSKDLLK